MAVEHLAAIATKAGYPAIEVDRTGRPPWRGRYEPQPHIGAARPRIAALWLPYGMKGHSIDRWQRTEPAIRQSLAARPERVVIAMPKNETLLSRAEIAGIAESVRALVGAELPITLALASESLLGGRSHLAQLTVLRRLAAEWEFDLALDLTGKLDTRWEAEAAILRLGARLRLLRVAGVRRGGDWHPAARLVARAVTAALQAEPGVTLSLVPALAPWQRLSARSVARAASENLALVDARRTWLAQEWRVATEDEPIRRGVRGEGT